MTQAYLYMGFSKALNSTKVPTESDFHATIDINFKDGASVINPTIQLQVSADSIQPFIYDYCYLTAFQRYYFITDWVIEQGVWTGYLDVDVLGSYAAQINSTTQFISRSDSLVNPFLADGVLPTSVRPFTHTQNISQVFTANITSGYFVLGVSSNQSNHAVSGGTINYYICGANAMIGIMDQIFTSNMYYSGIAPEEISQQLFNALINPNQYLISCKWFPFAALPANVTTAQIFKIGFYQFGVSSGAQPNNYIGIMNSDSVVVHEASIPLMQNPYMSQGVDDYLNYMPFTMRKLHVPPFGDIVLDNPAMGKCTALGIRIITDMISGAGELELTGSDGTATIFLGRYSGQVGVEIATAFSTNNNTLESYAIGGSLIDVGSMLNIGQLSDVGSMILGSGYATSTLGSTGSFAAYYDAPNLTTNFMQPSALGTLKLRHLGYPYESMNAVNASDGYTKCRNVYLPFKCLSTEKQRIINYMESGFINEFVLQPTE